MKTPRRVFAASMVVTVGMLPGCKRRYEGVNPPVPESHNPPDPGSGSAPTPSPGSMTWHVMRDPAAPTSCSAVPNTSCPTPKPGEPTMTCNPPRPAHYACPDGVTDASFTVTQIGSACEVRFGDDCPPDTKCNPPAPVKVPCPSY